jgi:hypothetical protein
VAVLLYEGKPNEALVVLDGARKQVRASMLERLPWVMFEHNRYLSMAFALAGREPETLKLARGFDKLGGPPGDGVAALSRAWLAHRAGDRAAAERQLALAQRSFESGDMSHMAAACRARLGGLLAGPEGERMVKDGHAWFAGQGDARARAHDRGARPAVRVGCRPCPGT